MVGRFATARGGEPALNTAVRAAHPDDFSILRAMIARAFKTEDEANLWDYLLANDPGLTPECIRVATRDDQPVACTVVLPRQIRGREGWVSGAIITLVTCDPDFQGQGFGSLTVRDAIAFMTARGMSMGVLYGHPDYYPRFGFVPVLPGYRTTIPAYAFIDPEVELDTANPADYPALAALYAEQTGFYPCAVARPADAWLWTPRNGDDNAVLTLPNREGYAVVTVEHDRSHIWVHEAGARNVEAGRQLLAGLCTDARSRGFETVAMAMPPDHMLPRLAMLAPEQMPARLRFGKTTFEQNYWAAAPGMAIVTNWEPLLPLGYDATAEGLLRAKRLVLQVDHKALTELVVGYRGLDDLLLAGQARLSGSKLDADAIRKDLAPGFPKWSLAPFWS